MKKYVIIVNGYIRGKMFQTIEDKLDELIDCCMDDEYVGIHVHPYNSSGAQTYIVSNHNIPSEDIRGILNACGDLDIDEYNRGIVDAGSIFYADPLLLPTDTWSLSDDYYYVGGMIGKNDNGRGVYEV